MRHRRGHSVAGLCSLIVLLGATIGCQTPKQRAAARAKLHQEMREAGFTAAERVAEDGTVSAPSIAGLAEPQAVTEVDALATPPAGWNPDPLKATERHAHQVWISPSGSTAYGVIRFSLPFPVGADLALWGFMREMKRSEGEAELLDRWRDPDLPGIRFI